MPTAVHTYRHIHVNFPMYLLLHNILLAPILKWLEVTCGSSDLFSFLSCFDLVHLLKLLLEPVASGNQKQLLVLLHAKIRTDG